VHLLQVFWDGLQIGKSAEQLKLDKHYTHSPISILQNGEAGYIEEHSEFVEQLTQESF
jgi:hypothetical protein